MALPLQILPPAGEFINHYVFPDGELPHVSQVLREMEETGLEVWDVESLRRHYARTCLAWADRLEATSAHVESIAGAIRTRIWQVYLAGCAYGFAMGWMSPYQILAFRTDNDIVTSLRKVCTCYVLSVSSRNNVQQ